MGNFYLYLNSVVAYWWAFMMGCPFIIDEAIKWLWPTGKDWLANHLSSQKRRRVEIVLMVFGIFLAGFLAFNEEHAARMAAERKITEGVVRDGRHLSPNQRQRMQLALQLTPTEKYAFQVNSSPSCDECELFAEEIREFLNTIPGWQASGSPLIFAQPFRRGLWLVSREDEKHIPPVEKLDKAFGDAGFPLIRQSDAFEPGGFVIVVGRPGT